MDDMDEIVQEFLIESSENLDQLDRDLLALEVEPESHEKLSSAFRTIHTIKGTSGFLAFGRLEKLTHTGESLLARLRDGRQTMDTATADALLQMVDTVRSLLRSIEQTGTDGDVDIDSVMQLIRVRIAPDPTLPESPPAETSHAAEPGTDPLALPPPEEHPSPADSPVHPSSPAHPSSRRAAADSSLRVDVDLLDRLMALAGELVLTRNQLLRGVGEFGDPALARSAQRLNVITTDLQENIMKTRMQPVDHLWSKLPRVVRDLGSQCGKHVRLTMTGQDTELDRALLEAIKDPLTHLVRNAVDHGIEEPDDRAAAGKPREGVLGLRAYHNSGHVVIEVTDDGAGMDPAAIGAKAVERGLRTWAEVEETPEAELLQLVFEPGFSTAAAVTNVSGRGVGMDVVKTNLEAIGGAIELESIVGEGTTCRLRVPLTLAIVPSLTVACGADRYAIAQASVMELVALDPGHAASQIETVAGAPVYRLRGALLPLIALSDILAGSTPAGWSAGRAADHAHQVIVVLQAGNRRFGLLVDRVLNTEEIVVKALSPRLKTIGVYSGATILGDGTVALILDIQNLARRVLRTDGAERAAEAEAPAAATLSHETERLLIARVGNGDTVAISMSMVTRLETISARTVESIGSREVVQYRGEIIPLVRLGTQLGVRSELQPDELPVAIYTQHGHSAAIVMDEIIDIVEHDASDSSDIDDAGFIGSAVVRGQIVGLVDVDKAIAAADPGFFAAIRADETGQAAPAVDRSGSAPAPGVVPSARTAADDHIGHGHIGLVGVNGR